MADYYTRAARRAGIPAWLMYAVSGQESGGNQGAVSPKGARGTMQLMPGTARALERRYGINTRTRWGNILGGAYYLKEQLDRFGTIPLALAAYNAGPGAVKQYGGIPPYRETQDYVRSIMGKKPRGKSGGVSGTDLPGSFAPGLEPGGSTPGTPAPLPSYTVDDAMQEGLAALARGQYDPTAGLRALQRAAEATARASLASLKRSNNVGTLSMPIEVDGGAQNPVARKAASMVQKYLGTDYVWGGATPRGFDCSGLLQWVWGHLGVKIPRVTYDQWRAGKAVGKGGLRPGDAVFFHPGQRGPEHVGMYIGHGMFVESPHTGAKVRISKLRGRSDYMGARRYS